MHIWKHFKTITKHKIMVLRGCFYVGLYWQGLAHDMSKYMPSEFWIGAKYYQGTQSPNNAERAQKGYSSAWLHHKGRNKHHYEYWMDYSSVTGQGIIPARMPEKYVIEMFIDRVSASKNYNAGNYRDDFPLQYYQKGKAGTWMHEDTRKTLEFLLHKLADEGEEKTFKYIKNEMLGKSKHSHLNKKTVEIK